MKKSQITICIILLVTCISCSPKRSGEAPKADSTSVDLISSSAAIVNKKDSTHKFIRTADLKFKVKNVVKTTTEIEGIASRQGGFVTYTNLSSNFEDQVNDHVSHDSILITIHYTVSNTMIIRIPNVRLDSTLKEIAKNIDFLDYRIIKADDVALQMLSNNLTIRRSAKNESRLTDAIDKRGKKLNETTNAEEVLLGKQEQADNARVANLTLKDQLNFSTINLNFYQHPSFRHEMVASDRTKKYEPGFGSKIVDSMATGWDILEAVVVFLFNLWGLILLGIIVFGIYKFYMIKIKKQ